MTYYSTRPSGMFAQPLFTEFRFRFALRAYVTTKNNAKLVDFECAASSAKDLAFWFNLPQTLQVMR